MRSRVSLLLVCGQGRWEDTTGALESTKRFAGQLAEKAIRHELDLYEEKLGEYRRLADAYFQADEYEAFCADRLPHLEDALGEYVAGPEFDRMLVETVRSTFPADEHEQLVAHYRGILAAWLGYHEQACT